MSHLVEEFTVRLTSPSISHWGMNPSYWYSSLNIIRILFDFGHTLSHACISTSRTPPDFDLSPIDNQKADGVIPWLTPRCPATNTPTGGVTASRFASQTREPILLETLSRPTPGSKKPRNPNTLIVTTKLSSPTPTLLSYLSSINRYTTPLSIISALFTTLHENLYIYIYRLSNWRNRFESGRHRAGVSSLFGTKTRFQAWLNGPTEIQNFSRRDRHQDLRVSDERGRKEKEEMVFNPKTSGALEGDNRKSISPIKSVRKPMVERTRTSCIINLSFSLSLYLFLDNIYQSRSRSPEQADRVLRFLLTIQIEYTRPDPPSLSCRHDVREFCFKLGKEIPLMRIYCTIFIPTMELQAPLLF